ncbi:F-box protein CPR1 [Linum grandiflorum]
MSDHLPDDLITGILLRLPVSELLRCRCVSRAWRSMIDSPSFSKLQIDYSAATNKNASLVISEIHGGYAVVDYANGLQLGIGITTPAKSRGMDLRSGFTVMGSCNGLVCFLHDWEKVLIWNPATSNGCFFPHTFDLKPHSVDYLAVLTHKLTYNQGYGFGYDSISDDYKVVQVFQMLKPGVNSFQSQLVSYGVRSNSLVEVEFPYILPSPVQTGAFVGGAIHWTVVRHKEDLGSEGEMLFVGFDLGLNEFREVSQPKYRGGGSLSLKLGELGKCLCIFVDYKDKFVDVWVMKEYGVEESWSILFSVQHPELCYSNRIVPLGFSVTGQEVLLQLDCKRLVWYDLKDPNKVVAAEEINVHGLKGKMDAIVCFGSLVSPFPPKEEVKKVVKQQKKPGPQRKQRDDFLARGFKLKL